MLKMFRHNWLKGELELLGWWVPLQESWDDQFDFDRERSHKKVVKDTNTLGL